MGFDRVAITHGRNEYGRDLVFRDRDRIGRDVWRGVQVKAKAPTGSLTTDRGLRTVLTQCEAALDTPYITNSGERVSLSEIWLIVTKPIGEIARSSAEGRLTGRVQIIDGVHLADLLAEYLPDLIRQRSKPIDEYLLSLTDLLDLTNPYLSTKLGTTLSVANVYLPPLAALDLLRPQALVQIQADRIEASLHFEPAPVEEFAYLAVSSLLPALYHYKAFGTLSRMLTLINSASELQCLNQISAPSRSIPMEVAAALSISLTATGGDSQRYFYCGALKREQVRAIASTLEKIERPELAPLKETSPQESSYRKARKEQQREDFLRRVVETYNKAVDNENNPFIAIVPLVAKVLFERANRSGGWPVPKRHRKHEHVILSVLTSATAQWTQYIDDLTTSFVERASAVLKDVDAAVARISTKGSLLEGDVATLSEARALTLFAQRFYKLPDDAITHRELDAAWLCEHVPALLIEGELGIGKTTLLRRAASDCAKSFSTKTTSPVPILCPLARVSDDVRSFEVRLIEAAHERLGEAGLQHTPVRWFLDGFDEIRDSSVRQALIAWIKSTTPSPNIVLSSRPFALHDELPAVLQVTLLPFKDDQIAEFVKRFPWREACNASTMLEVLTREKDLRELGRSPLLLTLMCILAQARGVSNLPARRATLYGLIVDLLLTEWDLAKGIQRERIVDDVALRLAVLERTAYGLYERGLRYFSRDECVDVIVSSYPLTDGSLELGLILFADLVRDCILVPGGQGQFGFLHYSIQEYLAARELSRDVNLERVLRAMREFSAKGRWEEVLVFYAGIKRDIGPLLTCAEFPSALGGSDWPRLMERMLKVADFTRPETLEVHGTLARMFEALEIGGMREHWRRLVYDW